LESIEHLYWRLATKFCHRYLLVLAVIFEGKFCTQDDMCISLFAPWTMPNLERVRDACHSDKDSALEKCFRHNEAPGILQLTDK
jgi:hypothetical protein